MVTFFSDRSKWLVVILLTIQAGLLVHSAKVHSPTWDEVGHLAAGLSHWELGRFELYSVNPPLVRTIAAAPVYFFMQPEVDWTFYRQDPPLRSEVYVGRDFMKQHGEKAYDYFFIARLAVIPICLLGGWLCFLWATDLFGVRAGLVAVTLWAFSPNVLAYGSVISPDLSSAVAMLGVSYVLHRWLSQPTWGWSFALMATTALAMLTKSVWLMLPVVYLAMSMFNLWLNRQRSSSADTSPRLAFGRPSGQLALVCVGSLLLTNLFYGFTGSFRPLGDYQFVSDTFTGIAHQDLSLAASVSALADDVDSPPCVDCESDAAINVAVEKPGNRFAGSFLHRLPVPLPANYLHGLDVQTRDFERGHFDHGWQSYLWGQWKQGGWWYYYLVALFVKTPLIVWFLLAVGTCAACFRTLDRKTFISALCLWGPAIVILVLASSATGLHRYMRYVLPVVPVLFVWAAQAVGLVDRWLSSRGRLANAMAYGAIVLVIAFPALHRAPHYLSYFNSVAGGADGGHHVLCDSNVDWGQDLIELKSWLRSHPDAAENLHLAYFGSFDPAWVGIEYELPAAFYRSSIQQEAVVQSSVGPLPGWYVISKNYLVGHMMPVPSGSKSVHFKYFREPFCDYFAHFEPVDSIGHSMLVYHLKLDEVNQTRMAMGLHPLIPNEPSISSVAESTVAASTIAESTSSLVLVPPSSDLP